MRDGGAGNGGLAAVCHKTLGVCNPTLLFGDFFFSSIPLTPPTPRLAVAWTCRPSVRVVPGVFFACTGRAAALKAPGSTVCLAPLFHPPTRQPHTVTKNARVNPYQNKNKRGFLFFFSQTFFWGERPCNTLAVSRPFAGAAPKKTSFYLFFLPLLTRDRQLVRPWCVCGAQARPRAGGARLRQIFSRPNGGPAAVTAGHRAATAESVDARPPAAACVLIACVAWVALQKACGGSRGGGEFAAAPHSQTSPPTSPHSPAAARPSQRCCCWRSP